MALKRKREMALMNLFSGQQWRIRNREQTYVHGGRRDVQGDVRREKGRCMETVTQKFTNHIQNRQPMGIFCVTQGTQTGALRQAE